VAAAVAEEVVEKEAAEVAVEAAEVLEEVQRQSRA
jgi:hypothetical protein